MIRFSCPACHKVFKVVDSGAGRKINCPQCGQRILVPTPPQLVDVNKPVWTQLKPATSTPLVPVESDNLVQHGLRKDGDQRERGGERVGRKPARSWTATVCAVLALILAVVATPAAVIYHPQLCIGLSGAGLFFGTCGLFIAIKLRAAGCGMSLAGTAVCGSILFSAIILLSKQVAPEDRREQTNVAKQNHKNAQPNKEEPSRQTDSQENEAEGKADFDPNDFKRTLEWVAIVLNTLQKDRGNAIRYSDTLMNLDKKVRAHAGAKVRWELKVSSVEETYVILDGDYKLDSVYDRNKWTLGDSPPALRLVENRFKERRAWGNRFHNITPAEEMLRRGDEVIGKEFSLLSLDVDEGVDRETAAKLNPAGKVTVRADIAEIFLEDINNWKDYYHVKVIMKNFRAE